MDIAYLRGGADDDVPADDAGSLIGFAGYNSQKWQLTGGNLCSPAGESIPGRVGSGAAAKAGAWRGGHGDLGPRRGGDELATAAGVKGGELRFAGGRPGPSGLKSRVNAPHGRCELSALDAWPQKHLYFVAG